MTGAFAHRFEGLSAGKEKRFRASLAIVVAQEAHQVVTEQGVALTVAFGMRHQQSMAGAVEVFDLNVGGFRQAQTAAVDATEESAGAQVALGAAAQKPFDFGHTVNPRHAGWASRPLDLPEDGFDVALEQSAEEVAHGIDGQIDGGSGLLALGN